MGVGGLEMELQGKLAQSCFVKSNIPYRLRHDQVTAAECFIMSQQRSSDSVCAFNLLQTRDFFALGDCELSQ